MWNWTDSPVGGCWNAVSEMNDMKKLLLIAYYWPPSGGPGVQRWLKMSYYLAELGCDITVLTVSQESANYPNQDDELLSEVHPSIRVIRTKAWNPYKLLQIGGKKGGTNAASNFSIPKESRWKFKVLSVLRTHLFIPDPRRGWNRFAIRKAKQLLTEDQFDAIITTSPPHSTQLIGWKLKKKFGLKWIVDFRDPWSGIIFYHELGHSLFSRYIDRYYESQVVKNADKIVVVGDKMKSDLSGEFKMNGQNIEVIHNGFDNRDFEQIPNEPDSNGPFKVVYTGTLSSLYNYQPMFEAVAACAKEFPIKCDVYGKIHDDIKSELLGICPEFEFHGEVKHSEVNEKQQSADLLVMAIADVPNAEHVISGKLFEYLKSGNPILCLGPPQGDAAKIIQACEAGRTFERHELEEMRTFILELAERKRSRKPFKSNQAVISRYSREALAKKVYDLL